MITALAGADPRNDNPRGQAGTVGKTNNLQEAFSTTDVLPVNLPGFVSGNAAYPSPKSVKGRVLGSLFRGEQLTHWDCWKRFGSARLSHHVYVLRGLGLPVQMIERTVSTSDAGRPATIGVYFLDAGAIAAAGERGQHYAAECARIEAERRAA